MAFHSLRLRRTLSLSSSLLHNLLHHQPKPIFPLLAVPHLLPASSSSTGGNAPRTFTSTTSLLFSSRSKVFDPETDELGPDTILFEGCDYNHWLITVDFPKDANLSREVMIETYVNIAAQVFGSVEEAKKKIYALSTTTYQGFQVECSEDTSKKFEGLPGVVFILPDSYIDPVNKEYGGDKYVNGEIFPRPPPVHYGRHRTSRERLPRDQPNYGPPRQQNYGPPQQQQNYGPPQQQQNYGPSQQQQNYGPPQQQQNYGPPLPQQNYGPPLPQQNYGPPPSKQDYGPPIPRKDYGLPIPRQNYGPSPPHQQDYGPPTPQQDYRPPTPRQDYGVPPPHQQNYGPPTPQQNYEPPPPQQNYGPPTPQQNYDPQGQRDFRHK